MKTTSISSPWWSSRGSAFITVLIFAFVLLMVAASVMQWSLTERRLNARSAYWLEARNAAEAVAEYGAYQVVQAFNTKMNPTFSGTSATSPIHLPTNTTYASAGAQALFTGSHVDPTSLDLQVGDPHQVPSSAMYYIDPNDPNNQGDSLKGRYVVRRDVPVFARATVIPPTGGGPPVTAYVEEKVSVRGAPLFAYAIFYGSNDLELQPVSQMDIYGPVHVNGNLTVAAISGNTVNFHGPVTVAGSVFHAWSGTTSAAQEGGGSPINYTTNVNFAKDLSGTIVNDGSYSMRTTAGVWNDSTMGNSGTSTGDAVAGITNLLSLVTTSRSAQFSQYATQRWRGYLQTTAMGVQSYDPMGFSEIVGHDSTTNTDILATSDAADDGSKVGTGAGYGHGYGPHSLIEAPITTTVPTTDPYYAGKTAIEEQKFSRKAGLYVQVVVTPGANGAPDDYAIKLYGDPNSGLHDGTDGPNGGKLLASTALGNVPANVIQPVRYQAVKTNSAATVAGTRLEYGTTGVAPNINWRTRVRTGGTIGYSNATVTWNGSGSVGVSGGTPTAYSGGTDGSWTTDTTAYTSAASALTHAPGYSGSTYAYTPSGTASTTDSDSTATVTQGMYDRRQQARVNLLQIDMAALRTALTDMKNGTTTAGTDIVDASGAAWGLGTSGGYDKYTEGTSGWNGAIYVEVQSPSTCQTGVILANGRVSGGTTSLVPTGTNAPNGVTGLTVATNTSAYILGDFNADGTIGSSGTANSAQYPDDGHSGAAGDASAESPVAIAADAVTILSTNFFGTGGSHKLAPSGSATNPASTHAYLSRSDTTTFGLPVTSGSNIEVAAALISGTTPTSASAYSGGAHNLPRFLENWGSGVTNTIAIRGSLVCMYKNRTVTGNWSNQIYFPGSRQWGFDKIFANGNFPPICPQVISYRRVDFTYLRNATEYASTIANPWP